MAIKQQKYNWKETNLALFGSDTEKSVKKESAMHEPAWKPVLACRDPRKFVWRIEKFQVKQWPELQYGTFYNGDSFIVLNVYKRNEKDTALRYDVHFWIGKQSTADEYGTAAYKTVELDAALDGKAVQHREVEGYESEKFRSYFKEITILKGGVESGFNHVTPEEYQPRLLLVSERMMRQVSLRTEIDARCVWILDCGVKLYQFNGAESKPSDRHHASKLLASIRNERFGRATHEVLEEADINSGHEFYTTLAAFAKTFKFDSMKKAKKRKGTLAETTLYVLDQASPSNRNNIIFQNVATRKIRRQQLNESRVNLLITPNRVFVYVGAQAKASEKLNALSYAHNFLTTTPHSIMPITVVGADDAPTYAEFEAAFGKSHKKSRCILQ